MLISRKLTFEYDQMCVTSKIPKNDKKCYKKNIYIILKLKYIILKTIDTVLKIR